MPAAGGHRPRCVRAAATGAAALAASPLREPDLMIVDADLGVVD